MSLVSDILIETYEEEHLYEMANLTKKKTGLSVDIWSEHKGSSRNVSHNSPRIKLSNNEMSIVISIAKNPLILALPSGLSRKEAYRIFKDGIEYIKNNYDIFLNHYNDVDDSFDDEELFKALRDKGVYK